MFNLHLLVLFFYFSFVLPFTPFSHHALHNHRDVWKHYKHVAVKQKLAYLQTLEVFNIPIFVMNKLKQEIKKQQMVSPKK